MILTAIMIVVVKIKLLVTKTITIVIVTTPLLTSINQYTFGILNPSLILNKTILYH